MKKQAPGRGKALLFAACLAFLMPMVPSEALSLEILNVSYDPTRELYQEVNTAFCAQWKETTGQELVIRQSHGGSGKQARSVINGLEADVVTLALGFDIDAIASRTKLLPDNWQSRFPFNNCPYTSTIVFLVRKGNPKGIRDWDDLAVKGVEVITPNPKTSGGARWNFLAAWGYSMKKRPGDEEAARGFVSAIFHNVPVLDTGARGSTNTFLRGIGDVLLAWENEALLAVNRLGRKDVEIVVPSLSILAEPPIALVEGITQRRGTTEIAKAYLSFLYAEKGQEMCARHFYRPRNPQVAKRFADQFPKVEMFTLSEMFGSWEEAHRKHFSEGGTFDQIYQ